MWFQSHDVYANLQSTCCWLNSVRTRNLELSFPTLPEFTLFIALLHLRLIDSPITIFQFVYVLTRWHFLNQGQAQLQSRPPCRAPFCPTQGRTWAEPVSGTSRGLGPLSVLLSPPQTGSNQSHRSPCPPPPMNTERGSPAQDAAWSPRSDRSSSALSSWTKTGVSHQLRVSICDKSWNRAYYSFSIASVGHTVCQWHLHDVMWDWTHTCLYRTDATLG